jgi:GTP cyclohydrolase I
VNKEKKTVNANSGGDANDGGAPEKSKLQLEGLVTQILERIGEDPEREGLRRTPLRVSQALEFLTQGYRTSPAEVINNAVFEETYDELVIVKNVEFYSMCEHHLLPFFGVAHVGYIPNGKVIGLSKIPRLIEVFSRRLQLQERMTLQIAECLMEALEPLGVGVVCEARHLCMMMRGVQREKATAQTSAMLGAFRDERQTRNEFLSLIGHTSL